MVRIKIVGMKKKALLSGILKIGFILSVFLWLMGCATHERVALAQHLKYFEQKAKAVKVDAVKPVFLEDDRAVELRYKIDSLINASGIPDKAFIGIHIEVVDEGILYDRDGDKLFTPASTAKLLTGIAALHYLGQEFRFKTEIYRDEHGRIYIKGYGDPSLTTGDLYEIAHHLQLMGIKEVPELIIDDSYFDTLWMGHGWMWDDEPYPYMAHISAVSVDHNVIEVIVMPNSEAGKKALVSVFPQSEFVEVENFARTTDTGKTKLKVGRVYENGKNIVVVKGQINRKTEHVSYWRNIEQPSLHVGYVFDHILGTLGIKTGHVIRRDAVPSYLEKPLFVHKSRPLFEIVADMLKPSSNFVAEQLLKTIGAETDTVPGTAYTGISAIIKMILSENIGDTSQFRLADGSGLSRYNLVSPKLLTSLLIWAYKNHKLSPEILSALPIGGVDGTLYKRMEWDENERRVRAKTGSMTSVSALAGLLWSQNGHVVAFAIMTNNFLGSSKPVKELEDSIVQLLLEY